MLGYQKSSPAHALYPQTATDRNIPTPSRATISGEKPSQIQMTGKEKGASSRDAFLIGI
jgi:hypothetical protein